MRTICLAIAATTLVLAPTVVHADDSCNLDIRSNYRTLVGAQNASRQWVEFHRTDSVGETGSRIINRDDAIFAAEFQRVAESNAMQAPNDFTFRSGWILNSQFAFKQGEKLPIKAIYDLPSGDRFYALQPAGESHLTIFAKPDGTMCNKVMNSSGGDHVFLIKEYRTNPATKLAMSSPRLAARAPLTLRIIYLGSSGGIASFRTLWSQDGRILQNEDVQYDQTATQLQLAGLNIPVSDMTAETVTVGDFPLTDRIAWDAYWTRLFRD